MMVRISGDQSFLRVNPVFETRLGLTIEDLSVKPFLDWIHPDDRDALAEILDTKIGYAIARHLTNSGFLECTGGR